MNDNEYLESLLSIVRRRPFTLEDLRSLTDVLIEWKGIGWEMPAHVHLRLFGRSIRLDVLEHLVKAISKARQ